jgi:hypothetical protein
MRLVSYGRPTFSTSRRADERPEAATIRRIASRPKRAAAVGHEEAVHLASAHRQIQAIEGARPAEPLLEARGLDNDVFNGLRLRPGARSENRHT